MYTVREDTIRISVRNLVEFLLQSGDINSGGNIPDARIMQEGARIHRKIQKSMGSRYHSEVPLSHEISCRGEGAFKGYIAGMPYKIVIEGRADGIICDLDENEEGMKIPLSEVCIDEIKTMQADVMKLMQPVEIHKAQAMCYAYVFLKKHKLDRISIQLTYCNVETEQIKRFKEEYSQEEISAWFDELINRLFRWTDFIFDSRAIRQASIKELAFPYEYRQGQKKLVVSVYKAVENSENLYIQAPTGVGKTISTVFPSVVAMGQEYADKIFYLTSKTITRTVAEETFESLRNKGACLRTVTITAKDKICILEERECAPHACPYAKGHFSRINDAVYDVITNNYRIDRECIEEYAKKHTVCPFELGLDVSFWCDGIICDYNYVFDPNVALKRYFNEKADGEYIFLVDEAHNLVDRAREMYSAVIKKEDFLRVKKFVKDVNKRLASAFEKCNRKLLELKRSCDSCLVLSGVEELGTLMRDIEYAAMGIYNFLDKNKTFLYYDELLEFYFELRHFLNMYDVLDDKYMIYTEHDSNGDFLLHLYCVDPSGNIADRLAYARMGVFFSATLLPVNYYKEMITGNTENMAIYAQSSFDTANRRLLVANDVTSRYTRRNVPEYEKICKYIYDTISAKSGKYMVFFPSYSYMQAVYEVYRQKYKCGELVKCNDETIAALLENDMDYIVVQNISMSEGEREWFLKLFDSFECRRSLVGFCVNGGIFSEGIDLKDESLIGVIIVGTGLPMICRERELLRQFFDEHSRDGYSYAYVYPGMNKVLQAAGRVIRTETDRGVIELLDDRFLKAEYQRLFPREWDNYMRVSCDTVGENIKGFWKNIVQR